MDDGNPLIRLIVFIVLLIINAAFSGAEIAVSAVNEAKLAKERDEGRKKAGDLLGIVEEPSGFMSAVDIVATSVSVIAGAYVAKPMFAELTQWLMMHITGIHIYAAAVLGHLIVIVILIYLVLIFGVLLPKRVAYRYCDRWAYASIGLIRTVSRICVPFVALVNGSVNVLVRLFGINPKHIEENVTEEEIIMMVSEGHEQGVIEASEAEMISNIFEFDDKEVADIMTHRKNICGVDVSLSIREAAELMAGERFSRFPVYENDIDNIIGILHLKDVVRLMLDGKTAVTIREVMRQPYYVPDTQNINTLFKEMQSKKVHMAVVIDEYGQTSGIIAMEDILEEIVGNILDEYDMDDEFIQDMGSHTYLMKGMTPLEEITDLLGLTFDDDFDTLNGFMISRLDYIPSSDEHAFILIDGYRFTVISVNDSTISMVKVSKEGKESQESIVQNN